MSNLMTNYFGPLDKSACVYFLIISFLYDSKKSKGKY